MVKIKIQFSRSPGVPSEFSTPRGCKNRGTCLFPATHCIDSMIVRQAIHSRYHIPCNPVRANFPRIFLSALVRRHSCRHTSADLRTRKWLYTRRKKVVVFLEGFAVYGETNLPSDREREFCVLVRVLDFIVPRKSTGNACRSSTAAFEDSRVNVVTRNILVFLCFFSFFLFNAFLISKQSNQAIDKFRGNFHFCEV